MSGGAARIPFPPEFPDVVIQQPFNPTVRPARHPDYVAAKAGDKAAAIRLVMDMVVPAKLDDIHLMIADQRPLVVAPHADEAQGRNAIPERHDGSSE